jgi:hypothetical protein
VMISSKTNTCINMLNSVAYKVIEIEKKWSGNWKKLDNLISTQLLKQ